MVPNRHFCYQHPAPQIRPYSNDCLSYKIRESSKKLNLALLASANIMRKMSERDVNCEQRPSNRAEIKDTNLYETCPEQSRRIEASVYRTICEIRTDLNERE